MNQHFGEVFSSLLPGTYARLKKCGETYKDGLEIRVKFGDVWKQSLAELSGGQRSLLALSLILSLLLCNPAPMYILDEIDAALDPSHTQNIGSMFRTHFKDSQFIIVSLKEGMFKNADVLFETKFMDGRSVVSRTERERDDDSDSDEDDDDTQFGGLKPRRICFKEKETRLIVYFHKMPKHILFS